jgi:nitrate/TMAO reductase-like tetraheme cytochrome c subunit
MKFTMKQTILTGALAVGIAALVPSLAWGVSGPCVNCHTMHNSQDGGSMNFDTSITAPQANLLRANGCIGCHANGTSNTGFAAGDIPQVNDATTPLAGGYFTDAAGVDTQHNVSDFTNMTTDAQLGNTPPGDTSGFTGPLTCGGSTGCHAASGNHHANTGGNVAATSGATSYRFLNPQASGKYVAGIEDDDYEFETSVDHNVYSGEDRGTGSAGLSQTNTISAFCGSCHGNFHAATDPAYQNNGTNWVRHPTDWSLVKAGGEYSAYTSYNPETPVGAVVANYTTSDDQNAVIGTNSDATLVVCLSCHRAHGNDQLDMLRFSYTQMVAGSGNTGGCFNCHTTKN